MVKKIILTTLFTTLSIIIFQLNPQVLAQEESTSSGSVEEIQKSLQDRIKKALDENLPTAEETIQKSKNRAVVGIIDSLNQGQITVRINPNLGSAERLHHVSTSPDTSITKAGKDIDSEEVEIGSYIIAIGLPESNDLLSANRVILSSFTKPSIYTEVAYATITAIDVDDDTVTLQNSHPQLEKPLDVTKKTEIFLPTKEELEITDLQPGQKAVAVFTINDKKDTVTLNKIIAFTPTTTSTPTPTEDTQTESSCGDGVCQNVACFGLDCPDPETPETCPADCTN